MQAQLRERGFVLERKKTEEMSKAELSAYKKSLKEEAAERRRLKKEAWQAYRATHVVHLGEGIFWNDESDLDRWDQPNAEERAAENELPALDTPAEARRGHGADAARAALARLPPRGGHAASTTGASPSPSATARRGAIWAPLPKLKAAQRWILRNVVERLPVHGASHGFLAEPIHRHQRRRRTPAPRSCSRSTSRTSSRR